MTENLQQLRKEVIIQKAIEVFAERGYNRSTIEEIAARSNLGKGTVYRCIGNKELLFLEILSAAAQIRRDAIPVNLDSITDLRGKLGRFIISLLRFAQNYPDYYKILNMKINTGREGFQKEVKALQEEYQEVIYQIFAEGVRHNKFREVNPLIATTFVSKLIEGSLEIFETEPTYTIDQLVLTILDLVWNGFAKK